MDQGEEPTKKLKTEGVSVLEQLKKFSVVVADTGQFKEIDKYKPEDATTNPSLILQAAEKAEYKQLIIDCVEYGKKNFRTAQEPVKRQSLRKPKKAKSKLDKDQQTAVEEEETKVEEEKPFVYEELSEEQKRSLIELICDKLAVEFGKKILELVPGVVSTEVDARLSFDKQATINRAKRVIQLYEELGIKRERVLIKIASTWEGIKAGEALKKEKINCNLTLLFSISQAIACGEAGIYLISPFVGRILDWHAKADPSKNYERHNDPGVKSVTQIYNYYKKFNYKTIVMGASFRNIGEIIELAGCDRLTIAPKFLEELNQKTDLTLKKLLDPENVKDMDIKELPMDEKSFRWHMNQDAMATEKLAEGIRKFAEDIEKLEKLVEDLLVTKKQ